MLKKILIMLATVFLVRGLWLVSSDETLDLHSGQQFTGHLIDFAESLKSGNLFPQWSVYARGGLGSPYLGFYQPGFAYIASACLVMTGDPQTAIALAISLFTVMGAIGIYFLARKIFNSGLIAASVATAFLGHPYMAVNLYERGDFAEFAWAMTLPWVFTGPARTLALAACVLLHPLLSYPLFLGMAFASRRNWPSLTIAALLSAFYWLPLLRELDLVSVDKAFVPALQPARHMLATGHVLMVGSNAPAPFHYQPNWILQLVALAGAFSALQKKDPLHRVALSSVVVLAGIYFLMSPASLPLWNYFPLLSKLQFPWRLQNFAALAVALLAGCGLSRLAREVKSPRLKSFALAAVAMMICLPLASTSPRLSPQPPLRTVDDILRSGFLGDPMDEWLPRNATVRVGNPDEATRSRESIGPCEISSVRRSPGRLSFSAKPSSNPGAAPTSCEVTLPQFFYPGGWTLTPDIPLRERQGFIVIDIPVGNLAEGRQEIVLTSKSSPGRRAGIAISTLALLGLPVTAALRKRQRRRVTMPVDKSPGSI